MIELKITQTVTEDALTIQLPENLRGKAVEITIKEIDTVEQKRKALQELLLSGPTWTDEQHQVYLEAKTHFEAWK